MPDQEGNIQGPGVQNTPDQAYKSGRPEDIEEGSLGAETGGPGEQKSRLPEESDGTGTAHAGGFAGQEADDSPDTGTPGPVSGEGDPSPHAQYDQTKAEESPTGGSTTEVPDEDEEGVKGAMNPAPGELGDHGQEEMGQRGYGQQPDYDANDPDARQPHPKTPSDMGNR
jgi:hypothetical protein